MGQFMSSRHRYSLPVQCIMLHVKAGWTGRGQLNRFSKREGENGRLHYWAAQPPPCILCCSLCLRIRKKSCRIPEFACLRSANIAFRPAEQYKSPAKSCAKARWMKMLPPATARCTRRATRQRSQILQEPLFSLLPAPAAQSVPQRPRFRTTQAPVAEARPASAADWHPLVSLCKPEQPPPTDTESATAAEVPATEPVEASDISEANELPVSIPTPDAVNQLPNRRLNHRLSKLQFRVWLLALGVLLVAGIAGLFFWKRKNVDR